MDSKSQGEALDASPRGVERVREGVSAVVGGAQEDPRAGFTGRVRSTLQEATARAPSCKRAVACAGYSAAVHDLAGVVNDAEAQLRLASQQTIQQSNMLAQLVRATQEIASLDPAASVTAAIPELALLVCAAAAAACLELGRDGSLRVLASCGAPFRTPRWQLEAAVRNAVRAGPLLLGACAGPPGAGGGSPRTGRLAAIPLGGKDVGAALVLERAADPWFHERDLEHLIVYGSLAGAALARSRAATELREAAARDAAILGAIRDGVIAVDARGVVRALNHAAAGALRVRPEDVLGRPLGAVPELRAVAAALGRAPSQPADVVSLPRGEVVLRTQRYEGGVVATIRDAVTEHTIAQRLVGSTARYTFEHIVGRAPQLLRVVEDARRAARSHVPILISGESGTGKELFAQAIHNESPGASGPFIGVNVTAIPRELLENELFGYEGGTFTGARSGGRAGKFEVAGDGTLLLDEIGDMPLEMQGKLLRVLQERVVQRLGSARDIPIRARIIATTHRDLEEAVRLGRFRLDLFHRLCVVQLRMPALRERREDVRRIVEHRLLVHAERTGRRVRVAPAILEALEAYHWPGNVRQLVNVVDGELALLRPGAEELARVPPALLERPPPREPSAPETEEIVALEELERRACERALSLSGGNVVRAAKALGIAKATLYNKLKRYRLASSEPSR